MVLFLSLSAVRKCLLERNISIFVEAVCSKNGNLSANNSKNFDTTCFLVKKKWKEKK